MKLVELLARELAEWPEGAGWASQDNDKEIRFDTPRFDFYVKDLADDSGDGYGDGAIVTREMWEIERAKVEGKTEWDGEGLPPVGVVCELRMTDGVWITATPTAYGKKRMIFEEARGEERIEFISKIQSRPILTQEQIAANVRNKAVGEMVSVWKRTMGRFAEEERGLAEMLYDAGYRKQEKSE